MNTENSKQAQDCCGAREMTALELINHKLADFREISQSSDHIRDGLAALRDCLPAVMPAKADDILRHMVSRITIL